MSSIKFLECIEDCFLTQMLDMPTRNEALLDLPLTNQEKLLYNISVSNSLGCCDHNIVEPRILLISLKISSKTKVLYFQKADFSSRRAQLGGIPWETSMEDKEVNTIWHFFKNAFLEPQKQFMSFKVKGRRQRKSLPWFNYEFLNMLRIKRKAYQRRTSG